MATKKAVKQSMKRRVKQTVKQTAHPVETLREYATALEAAMSVAAAKPKKEAVHRLRALVRRMEAQVELLAALSAVKPDSDEAVELDRRLRKMRRATGAVRDLDVQREMLKMHPSLPKKAAAELRVELKKDRERKAEKLRRVVMKQLPKVVAAIEGMVQSVGTANGLVLPDLSLLPLIERWKLAKEGSLTHEEPLAPAQMDDDQLHAVRKSAKAARYMAEGATQSLAAKRAAAKYENQQEAGGLWHDWLDLAETARAHFGGKHPLTLTARKQCDAARVAYLQAIG